MNTATVNLEQLKETIIIALYAGMNHVQDVEACREAAVKSYRTDVLFAHVAESLMTMALQRPDQPTCDCGCKCRAVFYCTGFDYDPGHPLGQGQPFRNLPLCRNTAECLRESSAELKLPFTMTPIPETTP